MGVTRLKTFLKSTRPPPTATIPSGSTLLFDGNGWVFHLIQNNLRNQVCLGNYREVDRVVRRLLGKMRRHGINARFYWDGSSDRLKEGTKKARSLQKSDERLGLYFSSLDGNHDKSKTPLPPLIFAQIKVTLTRERVTQKQCGGEADHEMVVDQQQIPNSYIVANDTDFHIFDVSYIQFDDLALSGKTIDAIVWDHPFLLETLAVSRSQLIEMAIFMGNDYTKPFRAEQYLDTSLRRSVGDVLEFLHNQRSGYRFRSTDPGLQRAIEYSRTIYSAPQSIAGVLATWVPRNVSAASMESTVESLVVEGVVSRGCGDALLRMLHQLDSPRTSHSPPVGYSAEAMEYQYRCLQLFPNLDPVCVFHGPLFSALVREAEAETATPADSDTTDEASIGRVGPTLPIDAYEADILHRVAENRVTIVVGETGSGKSSRVPSMLYHDACKRQCRPEIFVALPGRLATRNVCTHVKKALGSAVGMRMGMGVRTTTKRTRVTFTTTGYLVKLMINQPEKFARTTHIVIDEAHCRTIDSDLTCCYCKVLMDLYPRLKIVVMSATLDTVLYQDYFGVKTPPLFVGARRFKNTVHYAETYAAMFPPLGAVVNALVSTKSSGSSLFRTQAKLCVAIIRMIGGKRKQCSVLVFLSGISEIAELSSLIGAIHQTTTRYNCVPVHSTVPFSEQQKMFATPDANTINVILATNAAESGITVENVDYVVDFGTMKCYQQIAGSERLVRGWISKDSSVQRSGRTGRVRPGEVFRLYTRSRWNGFQEHDSAEISRLSLDGVVLGLLSTVGSGDSVARVLQRMIEPPPISTVGKAFIDLHDLGMITAPDVSATITPIGRMASQLQVSTMIARMCCLGRVLGCCDATAGLAAAMTCQGSPFVSTSPLFHSNTKYISNCRHVLESKLRFGNNDLCQPLTTWRVLQGWNSIPMKKRSKWVKTHHLSYSKLTELEKVYKHIKHQMDSIALTKPTASTKQDNHTPGQLPLHMVRFLMMWSFKSSVFISKEHRPNTVVETDMPGSILTSMIESIGWSPAPLYAVQQPWTQHTSGALTSTSSVDSVIETILMVKSADMVTVHSANDITIWTLDPLVCNDQPTFAQKHLSYYKYVASPPWKCASLNPTKKEVTVRTISNRFRSDRVAVAVDSQNLDLSEHLKSELTDVLTRVSTGAHNVVCHRKDGLSFFEKFLCYTASGFRDWKLCFQNTSYTTKLPRLAFKTPSGVSINFQRNSVPLTVYPTRRAALVGCCASMMHDQHGKYAIVSNVTLVEADRSEALLRLVGLADMADMAGLKSVGPDLILRCDDLNRRISSHLAASVEPNTELYDELDYLLTLFAVG